MTATRTIQVWDWENGLTETTAAPTPIPGLYITEDTAKPGTWAIIHLSSGCAVAVNLGNPEQAFGLTIRLGPLCDWTKPVKELLSNPQLKKQRQEILDEAGVLHLQNREPAPRNELLTREPLT